MEQRTLGNSAVKLSRIGLGCMGMSEFYGPSRDEDSLALIRQAVDLGINFFDTADVYGGKKGQGVTEQIIGRWLASGGRRERIILATKVHGTMGEATFDRGLSAAHIRRACEDSLRRLQTDYIDLYQMHHIERSTPWDEIFQAMQTLVQQGKIIYVGGSNFAAWDIATANQIAARRNFLGLVSEQSKYSLACRHIELEVLPCCRHYGVGVIPWSPLDGGLLGGVLNPGKEGRRVGESMLKRSAALRPTLEKWEDFCRRLGEKPAAVALAWMLANPVVTSPIIGPRTMDQLVGAMRALDLKLDASALKTLDEIWPGPGGEAPQADAW